MRLHVDLDTRRFVPEPGLLQSLSLSFKRGDTIPIDVRFCQGATVVELPVGTTFRFGIKHTLAGDYLVFTSVCAESGSGETKTYRFEPNFGTEELNAALEDLNSLPALLEIEWTSGGAVTSTETKAITLENDLNKGGEGGASVAESLPAQIPVFLYAITRIEGGTEADLDAVETTELLVPRLYAALIHGVLKFWRLRAGTDANSTTILRPLDFNTDTNAKVWELLPNYFMPASPAVRFKDGFVQVLNRSTGKWHSLYADGPDGAATLMVEATGDDEQQSNDEIQSFGAVLPGAPRWVDTVPQTASSPGRKGDVAADPWGFYFCIATDTWRRAELSLWDF